jgi:hypothetical protein
MPLGHTIVGIGTPTYRQAKHLSGLLAAAVEHTTHHIINSADFIQKLRGRVSKEVTNGSKTAVRDVIGFLCVSLGSSTVLLHDSLGSRNACACSEAGFGDQDGDRATQERRSIL